MLRAFVFFGSLRGNGCTAKDLWKVCNDYGIVVNVFIPNKKSKVRKRFAFVRFIKVTNLDRLIENLNSIWIGRFHLFANPVRFERPKKPNLSPHNNAAAASSYPRGVDQAKRQFQTGSYVNVVNGSFPMGVHGPSISSASVLVLDDSCVAERDLSNHIMGKVKGVSSISNLRTLIMEKGFSVVNLVYHRGVKSWFHVLQNVVHDFGEALDIEDNVDSSFGRKHLCIKTKLPLSILESFKGQKEMEYTSGEDSDVGPQKVPDRSQFSSIPINHIDESKKQQPEDPFNIYRMLRKQPGDDSHEQRRFQLWVNVKVMNNSQDVYKEASCDNVDSNVVKKGGEAVGNSGGILCVWEATVFKKNYATISDNFIAIYGTWLPSNSKADFGPIPFRFYHSWISLEGFNAMVEQTWRKYWNLVGSDLCDAVEHFFETGSFPNGCNSSFIALISKITDAKFVNDFRPISLVGSVYKVVTKAYDSVRWDYLLDVLEAFGFGNIWCKWIRGTFSFAKASILVNDSRTIEFSFHLGLKQGDPLSPCLFILIMESLNMSFTRAIDECVFKGVHLHGSTSISHLFYADDVMFIGEWFDDNLKVCKTRTFALGDKPHSFFAPEGKPSRRGLNSRPLACGMDKHIAKNKFDCKSNFSIPKGSMKILRYSRFSNADRVQNISHSIYVTNFPDSATSRDLWNACSVYGTVVDVFIPLKKSKVRYERPQKNHSNPSVIRKDPIRPFVSPTPIQHGYKTGSYVNAVNNSHSVPQGPVLSSAPALVLDDECLIDRDLSKYLMGKVKEFSSIPNLYTIFRDEGFPDVKLTYLGGLWVMIEYGNQITKDNMIKHKGVLSWFLDLLNANSDFVNDERIVWVDLEGIPLMLGLVKHLLGLETLHKGVLSWFLDLLNANNDFDWKVMGRVLILENDIDNSFGRKSICIKTKHHISILESFRIIVKGRVYMIRAKELFTWEPSFLTCKEKEYVSDDEFIRETSNNNDGQPPHDEVFGDVLGSDDEGKPETVFGSNLSSNKRANEDNGEVHLEDPFGIYDLLEKNKKVVGSMVGSQTIKSGGLVLEIMEGIIQVGKSMGYTMEGCAQDLEKIIRQDSVFPPPLVAKPKKGKSQTVTSTSPTSQGPKASGALSEKSKRPMSKKPPTKT
nr:hypothetical protein [Tanacetum cinerariifolium]